MSLVDTSIRRPVATAMVYLIIITLGYLGFQNLPVDLLPPIEYPQLTVSTRYENVGPEEVEKIITERVENAVAGVPNVERIRSNSQEGQSWVTLNFAQGANLDEAANDVRAAIDRLRRVLPLEVDAPAIWKFDPNNAPIVVLGASSSQKNLAQLTLTLERDIAKRFEQIPGVGTIDIWGGINRQIRVNLKRDIMGASGVTALEVQQALLRENTTLPGGNVKDGINERYVRTLGEFETVEEIGNTIIRFIGNKPIRIKDIADVTDTYADLNRLVHVDGEPMIRFGLRKQSGANTITVADDIKKMVDKINAEGSDLKLKVIRDQSTFIQSSIDNVKESALWGALLAVLILYFFLRNGSTTFIIALSIPISIIATFGLLFFNGLTLNQMSFGGLALGVGLIVDNAIVVLENIVRQRQNKKDLEYSAQVGTKQVLGAIIASTLTTTVIFLPVVFMKTITGILFQELALVVVFSLVCSLFVAMTLVPMLASKFLTVDEHYTERLQKKSRFFRLFERLEHRYSAFLSKSMSKKWIVYSVSGALFAAAFYAFPNIPVELAPQTDADEIDIRINMADGTNISVVNKFLAEVEALVKAATPMENVKYIASDVRDGRAEIGITLVDAKQRTMSPSAIADQIRSKVDGLVPGARVNVRAQSGLWILRRVFGSGGDESVSVELRGFDLTISDQLAQEIRSKMETVAGVKDVNISRSEGRPEENIVFNRIKIAELGLTVRDIAQTIQTNVGGLQSGVFRESGDEFPIIVRLQDDDRMSSLDLDNISVRTGDGRIVPISAVIEKRQSRGPVGINRVDGQRVNYINATLQSGIALGDAINGIQEVLADVYLPEGFSIQFGGEYEEQLRAQNDFKISIIIAMVLIYMVMAGQFERFLDPLIVMFSVPLALIGVVPVMLLTNTTINMQSLMGIIMLIGIVVNNAIVLVDYINLLRREQNMPVLEAVIEAGRLRLRPILMTTTTTVLGLVPLSFGFGPGGEIQASLARVVIGGLTASTLITLVLIPTIYVTTHKLKGLLAAKFQRNITQEASLDVAESVVS